MSLIDFTLLLRNMTLVRTLRLHYFRTLPKPPNPLQNPVHSCSLVTVDFSSKYRKLSLVSSILCRCVWISAHFDAESISSDSSKEENRRKTMKPLHLIFEEAVGLSEKLERSSDSENESETIELKKNLRKLEEQVRSLKKSTRESGGSIKNLKKKKTVARNDDGISKVNSNNSRSLYALFAANYSEKTLNMDCLRTEEDQRVYKELSPDMVLFVTHLYNQGYFNNANFLPRNTLDASCFENSYGRDFIKYAAEKFGKANQEIAKWLSASDLQKVASIGCPSFGRKNVFSAKRLRKFLGIQEDTVCSVCPLKTSCKFVNQSVWKGDNKNLNLAVVMRVITLYALESVPPELVVPEEVKDSVNRLLKEVVSLSQTVA